MAVRELIHTLADAGSFVELDGFKNCGVVTGLASLQSRPVSILAVEEAWQPEVAIQRMQRLLIKTAMTGSPLVMIFEGREKLADTACLWPLLKQIVRLSGVCPMIALMCAETGDAARLLTAFADFRVHCASVNPVSGCLDLHAADQPAAVETVRTLLSLLPANCAEDAPLLDIGDDLNRLCDVQSIVSACDLAAALADTDSACSLYADTHTSVLLARIGGRTVGVVACANEKTAKDAARFVRFCDCYSLPVVWICENMLPADVQLIFALAEATVCKIAVLLGSAAADAALFDMILSFAGSETAADADDSASPAEIRRLVINALELFSVKRDVLPPHKHGNMPL